MQLRNALVQELKFARVDRPNCHRLTGDAVIADDVGRLVARNGLFEEVEVIDERIKGDGNDEVGVANTEENFTNLLKGVAMIKSSLAMFLPMLEGRIGFEGSGKV